MKLSRRSFQALPWDKNNCGQSLVEFIIIIPLFFIILSGIISIFYLQNRRFIDFEAKISMSLSQFLFEKEERTQAQWDKFANENKEALKSILDKSLNPSVAFSLATDKKDQVFLDKNLVVYAESKKCSSKNTYSFIKKDQAQFQISTCSDKNGYENSSFSFHNVLDKFSLSWLQSEGSSVYYPFNELAWPNRASLIAKSLSQLMSSWQGVSFSQDYASFMFPKDNAFFNGKCFMEPLSPQCTLQNYLGKMNRAARNGANTQLFACHAEMVAKCTQTEALMPACVAEGLEEIKLSTQLGRPASSCPLVNKEIDSVFNFIKGKALSDSIENSLKEAHMRKKVF